MEAVEGLRDRKKRMLRQKISDTATSMFLQRGFDEVRVGEIAAACDVSEKTVFNYFPTKESLLFDREEDQTVQIIDALRPRPGVALIDSVLAVLERDTRSMQANWAASTEPQQDLSMIRRFASLIENTPALTAAMNAMTERLTQIAANALAERAGVDPDDPEPQLAAAMILGLWRVQFKAMQRFADSNLTLDEFLSAVVADVRRAASVADGGLSAFNAVVGSSSAQDQLRDAATAADQARRQVIAAVKQARAAWRQVVTEVQRHHAEDHHHGHHGDRWGDWSRYTGYEHLDRQQSREAQQDMRAQQRQMKAEIRQFQGAMRQRQAEMRRLQEQTRRDRRAR